KFYATLVGDSLTRLHVLANPMVRLVFLRQIYFTAVMSLRLLSGVALVVGAVFVAQITNVLGADQSLFDLVEGGLARRIAPLAAALIVIGRSATAISTELALMRCSGEIEALRGMRIPVHDYLIVPRIAAVTLATMGCCFYSQLIAVIGGFAVSSLMLDVALADELHRFAENVSLGKLLLGVLKLLCFRFFIAAIACATGLGAVARATEVPRVPARAFLRSVVAVLAIDAVFLFATL